MEGPRQRPGKSDRYRRSNSTVESSSRLEDDTAGDARISPQQHGHQRSYSFDAARVAASRRANENSSSSESAEDKALAGVGLPDRP